MIFTVSEICVASPVPSSEDDYGDYVMKEREARKEDVIEDADVEEGSDPIGDIFADILKGAGALLTEGIKIVTDATDGSVSMIIFYRVGKKRMATTIIQYMNYFGIKDFIYLVCQGHSF